MLRQVNRVTLKTGLARFCEWWHDHARVSDV